MVGVVHKWNISTVTQLFQTFISLSLLVSLGISSVFQTFVGIDLYGK